jgi:hypothetical protein
MNKQNIKKITLAISIAATMTSTAQSQQNNPFFATLSGGYFFDAEAPYAVLDLGKQISDDSFLSLQIFHSDNSVNDFAPVVVDETYTGFGVSFKKYQQIGDNGGLYYSAGGGIAFIDLDASLGSDRINESTEALYLTTTIGVQQKISENLIGHIGVRALWLDSFSEDRTFGGTTYRVRGPKHSINFGLEIGMTYKF